MTTQTPKETTMEKRRKERGVGDFYMSGRVFDVTPPAKGLQIVGPLERNKVVLDGYAVPMLEGVRKDGAWYFSLDERFSLDVPEEYGQGVAWMIANALAIGAGYSCFGENSKPLNRFKCKAFYLGVAPEIDTMEPEGGEQ